MAKSKVGAWNSFIKAARDIDEDRAIAVAQRILRDGPLNDVAYIKICGKAGDIYKRFLAENVFAINSDGLYDFQNKVVRNAVREHLGGVIE